MSPGEKSVTQTIAQKRAKHALNMVCGADGNSGFMKKSVKSQKKLNSYIAGFGPMILMNGFGQACAFYLSSKEKEHQDVYKAVAAWLSSSGRPFDGNQDLMNAIVNSNVSTYRLAQTEAMAYLDWLKKFSKAFLKSEEDTSNEKNGEGN